ncbi:hypothetical protein Halhy_0484 [Haliscomenobacter hydrossis DSM 1100]|uniref:Uncharacterized protein n=2 Tax=Haliscomenobacter TaxID=2349 RepID=F4KZ99_HALH1|nr:hypothetical protein Halhy_0484 [Haliscomenobacter hydrossis DSM 1100]
MPLICLKTFIGIFETMQTAIATPHRGFLLTSAAWKEVPESLCQEIPKIGEQLNQAIKFQDFSDAVSSVLFIAVMVPASHDDHRNDYRYNPKKKQIKIVQKLDYDFVMTASVAQFRAYFIEVLMTKLKQLHKQKAISDFDIAGLVDAIWALSERVFH